MANLLVTDGVRIALIADSLGVHSPRTAAASIVLKAMYGGADPTIFASRLARMTALATTAVASEVNVLRQKYRL